MTDSDPPHDTRMVVVFSTASIPEGHLVKGLLEADGIRVEIKGESEGPYRMGPVFLQVPESFEIQARLLLEEAASGSLADEAEEPANGEGSPDEGRH